MKAEVYVITDVEAISLIENGDIDGFKALLADGLDVKEPVVFNSEKEALAFCAGIGYGKDGYPVEQFPLRSFEEYDEPYIKAIKEY